MMFNECYFQARWHCACDWDVLHSCCYCRCCGFEGKVHKKWNSHETTRKNSNPQIYYIIHRSNPISLDKAPYLTGSEQLFGPRRLKLRWRVRRRICQNQLIQGWSASSRWTSSTQSPWMSPPLLRFPKRWAFSLSLVKWFNIPFDISHLQVNDDKKYVDFGYIPCNGHVPCQPAHLSPENVNWILMVDNDNFNISDGVQCSWWCFSWQFQTPACREDGGRRAVPRLQRQRSRTWRLLVDWACTYSLGSLIL